MGIGALTMARATGVIFRSEFPRYIYRRMTLEQTGGRNIRVHMLAEILAQGCANISALAIPGFMMAVNGHAPISGWEIAGAGLWLAAYILESTADMQKLRFTARHKIGVCDGGLWRYSRHPNYFAEWLVWTGLVTASVPSWLALRDIEALPVWLSLGVGAAGASVMMYITLVYLTGAVPAEYYSVKKRAGYRQYQETMNRFFPWLPNDSRNIPD